MCPRGCEGRWRRPPRPLSGRGWRGRRPLIVPVPSRVSARVVSPAWGAPRGRSSGIRSFGANRLPLARLSGGRGCDAPPPPPPRGPSREANRVGCGGFPPGFSVAGGGVCPHRVGAGAGALCAKSSVLPPGAGVRVRGWSRCSASGFPLGCQETPPGETFLECLLPAREYLLLLSKTARLPRRSCRGRE